jgi:hypothetical protein
MKPITRNLVIGGVLLVLGIISYGVYSIYSVANTVSTSRSVFIPSQLMETKVFKGEDFLAKTEIFKIKKVGFWQTVLKSAFAKDKKDGEQITNSEVAKGIYGFNDIKVIGNEIIAVGKFGGYVFDLNGNLKRDFLFEPQQGEMTVFGFKKERYYQALNELRIVEIAKDNYIFLTQGSVEGINTYDKDGKTIWKFGNRESELMKEKTPAEEEKETYVTEVSTGDLDDDGVAEYLVSQKNDGIRAFDQQGKEKWFQPDDYPTSDLIVVDIDGDGKTELLELQGKSSAIRDKKTGIVLKKLEIDGENILPNENTRQPIRFFEIDENKLKITNLENKTILESEASLSEIKRELPKSSPKSTPQIEVKDGERTVAMPDVNSLNNDTDSVYEPKAVWVSLKKDKPKYLAIIASFISFPRSNLYIYDEKGTLIYHELMPEDAETIAVLPNENGNESILVGGKNTLWKFSAN